jgi:hypothetical protein
MAASYVMTAVCSLSRLNAAPDVASSGRLNSLQMVMRLGIPKAIASANPTGVLKPANLVDGRILTMSVAATPASIILLFHAVKVMGIWRRMTIQTAT